MRTKILLLMLAITVSSSVVRAEDVTATLTQAPDWTSIRPDDGRQGRSLCDALRPLLDKKPEELRAELLKYVEAHKSDRDTLGALSRIYVLNRMFFNVPSEDRQDEVQFFGGWNGVPVANGKVNMLWPVGKDKDGNFVIVGTFSGYFGPDYRPLEEFDFFLQRYGKRRK